MEPDKEKRIRERAYEIWEREGKPQGRDAEHWQIAEREIETEGGTSRPAEGDGAAPSPPTAPSSPPRRRSRAVPKREGEEGTARARRKAEAP